MQSQILKSKISAHHGLHTRENELIPALNLLIKHPEIDMLEIDFVYDNGKFISAHDYEDETIALGSELCEWFNEVIPLHKMIWIDIKDSGWSILSENFSKFDLDIFFTLLRTEKNKFFDIGIQLENYIIISCQYDHLLDKIFSINNNEFLLAYDLPHVSSYVAKTITPACMDNIVDHFSQEYSEKILNDVTNGKCNIICLDMSFFMCVNDLIMLLNKVNNVSVVIIYSLELSDKITLSVPGKHIIVQYNFNEI